MKRLFIKNRHDVLEELEDLERYKKIAKDNKGTVHFEIVAHYGDCRDYEKIQISRKHYARLILEVEKIIQELNNEIENG